MDKDILRIIILIIGIILVLGIYAWDKLKKRSHRRSFKPRESAEDIEPLNMSAADDLDEEFDLEGIGPAVDELDYFAEDDPFDASPQRAPEAEGRDTAKAPTDDVPALIQLAVVARNRDGFEGPLLMRTLEQFGLEYGTMNIYHRYDPVTGNRLYSVASVVEPGTFPRDNLESFHCPGLLFFMQPGDLAYPIEAFEHLIQTVHKISAALSGEEWDAQRKPLTVETIERLRRSLYPAVSGPSA